MKGIASIALVKQATTTKAHPPVTALAARSSSLKEPQAGQLERAGHGQSDTAPAQSWHDRLPHKWRRAPLGTVPMAAPCVEMVRRCRAVEMRSAAPQAPSLELTNPIGLGSKPL
jgi:hypothetical protein